MPDTSTLQVDDSLKFDGLTKEELQQIIVDMERRLDSILLQTHVLLDIAKALNGSLNPNVIASNIISAMTALIAIDQASVFLYNESNQTFEIVGLFDSGTLTPTLPPNVDFALARKVLDLGQAAYQPPQSMQEQGWVCCLPLHSSKHQLGTINIHAIRQPGITPEQLEFLETIAEHASTALENARLYSRVTQESITDGLTGIYNHSHFQKRLRETIAYHSRRNHATSLGLLLIDIDHFKNFNDKYGHQFGDIVLKTVVQSIRNNIREEDFFARYGGEEFTLMVLDLSSDELLTISEKIRHIVEQTKIIYPDTGEIVSVTISIGCAMLKPDDDSSTFIRRADMALYRAKGRGRNTSVMG